MKESNNSIDKKMFVLFCRIIHSNQSVALYSLLIFTLNHFRFGSSVNSGRTVAYHPVATDRPTELEIQSQFVVINVNVERIPGVNLRVLYELMDVHGFNITYEIIPDSQPTRLNYSQPSGREPERDICILDHCRFVFWYIYIDWVTLMCP